MQPQDSAELHDIPLAIIVGVEKDKTDGSNRNVIKGYKSAGNGQPVPRAPAAAVVAQHHAQQAAAPARAAAPWAR